MSNINCDQDRIDRTMNRVGKILDDAGDRLDKTFADLDQVFRDLDKTRETGGIEIKRRRTIPLTLKNRWRLICIAFSRAKYMRL